MLGSSLPCVLSCLRTSDCDLICEQQSVAICNYGQCFLSSFADISVSSGIQCCCEKSEASLIFSLLLILFILSLGLRFHALTRLCFPDVCHDLFILILFFFLMFNDLTRLYLDVCCSRIIILGIYEVPFSFTDSSFMSVKFSCIMFQNISWFLFL